MPIVTRHCLNTRADPALRNYCLIKQPHRK